MNNLHPSHLADLRRSGLAEETIRAAGIYTVRPGDIGKKLKGNDTGIVSLLAFPYPGCDGFERYRCYYEDGHSGPKYRQPAGTSNRLYCPPGVDLAGATRLIITEGEKKALKLRQEGFPAVGLGGVWGWVQKGDGYRRPGENTPIADLEKVNWKRVVKIVFDSDGHGNQNVRLAAFRLARELCRRGATVSILFIPPGPGGEKRGADDFLVAHGPEAFKGLLAQVWPFSPSWSEVEAEVAWQTRDLSPQTPLPEKLKRLAVLVPTLARLSHLEQLAILEDLRVRLKLRASDLADLKADIKAARKAREAKEVQAKARCATPAPDPDATPDLEALRQAVAPLLMRPSILEHVLQTLEVLGLVGQKREAALLYLAFTSRTYESPVNVVVKGASAGGKSFLVSTVLQLFPKTAYYELSAMSERALAYSHEPLAHRFLVLYEAAGLGSDFAQYLMRSLLSEGRVRYETVEKGADGKLAPRLIEREGPTGLITTTTAISLHPENETRYLSLEADDSSRQTATVLCRQAQEAACQTGSAEADLASLHALQSLLDQEKPKVVVPFAIALAEGCDTKALRLRRDFPHLLTLIKAHAALHAHRRPRDEHGRVVAAPEDYEAVYPLVADVIAYGAGWKVDPRLREVVEAVDNQAKEDGVTVRQIAQKTGFAEATAWRLVRKAIRAGYLINQETRRGAPARLVKGDPIPPDGVVIPPPEEVIKKFQSTSPEKVKTVKTVTQDAEITDDSVFNPNENRVKTSKKVEGKFSSVGVGFHEVFTTHENDNTLDSFINDDSFQVFTDSKRGEDRPLNEADEDAPEVFEI